MYPDFSTLSLTQMVQKKPAQPTRGYLPEMLNRHSVEKKADPLFPLETIINFLIQFSGKKEQKSRVKNLFH